MRTITYITFSLFLLGFSLQIQAQEDDMNSLFKTKNATESLQMAQRFINRGQLERAKRQLKHTLGLKKDFAVAHRTLGKVYSELGKYEKAIDSYEVSFELNKKLSRAAYFECGEAHFHSGDFDAALDYFDKYESLEGTKYINRKRESGLEVEYDRLMEIRRYNISYALQAEKIIPNELPKNLEDKINSRYDEYLPTITQNGYRMVYTRNKRGLNENILTSVVNKKMEWTEGRPLDNKVNSQYNEGMAKYAANGKLFYFAGCERPDSEGGCDIYEAEVDIFGEVREVSHLKGLNTRYWDSQPCIDCPGNIIYFSSIRPGGYGGADIYMSRRNLDGTWGDAVNLGPNINTDKDEEAPFIAKDGRTLYFTSDGHPGYGDGDLFISRLDGEKWSMPKNMGYPINSQSKELGMYVKGDGKTILFASSRFGGKGGLDIYEYELPEDLRPTFTISVIGSIVDKIGGKPIQTTVRIYRQGEAYEYYTDRNGIFYTCLKGGSAYTFHVEAEGYKTFMSAVFLEAPKDYGITPIEINLIREEHTVVRTAVQTEIPPEPSKVIDKNDPRFASARVTRKGEKKVNFYFDSNSYELNGKAKGKLDDLVNTLSRDADWTVEVIGYADSSGDASYNKVLSEKRAGEVAGYLADSGIQIQKVRQEGRGAERASTEIEKWQSRRVEVVLRKR